MSESRLCPACERGDCWGHVAEYLRKVDDLTSVAVCRCPDPANRHGKMMPRRPASEKTQPPAPPTPEADPNQDLRDIFHKTLTQYLEDAITEEELFNYFIHKLIELGLIREGGVEHVRTEWQVTILWKGGREDSFGRYASREDAESAVDRSREAQLAARLWVLETFRKLVKEVRK